MWWLGEVAASATEYDGDGFTVQFPCEARARPVGYGKLATAVMAECSTRDTRYVAVRVDEATAAGANPHDLIETHFEDVAHGTRVGYVPWVRASGLGEASTIHGSEVRSYVHGSLAVGLLATRTDGTPVAIPASTAFFASLKFTDEAPPVVGPRPPIVAVTWREVTLPDGPALLLTGGDEPYVFVSEEGGTSTLYASSDAGLHWSKRAKKLVASSWAAAGPNLWLWTPDGLALSTDGGRKFAIVPRIPAGEGHVVAVRDGAALVTGGKVWQTHGADWILEEDLPAPPGMRLVGCARDDGNLHGTWSTGTTTHVWFNLHQGRSAYDWPNVPSAHVGNCAQFVGLKDGETYSRLAFRIDEFGTPWAGVGPELAIGEPVGAVHVWDGPTYLADATHLYRTSDAAKSWEEVSLPAGAVVAGIEALAGKLVVLSGDTPGGPIQKLYVLDE